MPLRTLLLPVVALLAPQPRWVEAFRDADVRVAYDAASIARQPDGTFAIVYRTELAEAREENGRRWNRALVESRLRCAPLGYRSVRVRLTQDDGPTIATRDEAALPENRDWRAPKPGTADLLVMQAACRSLGAGQGAGG